MPKEIEDRYLVFVPPSLSGLTPAKIVQGYLSGVKGPTVRVRKVNDDQGFLTIKGKKTGNSAPEFEYPIPVADAEELLLQCDDVILTKDRYEVTGADGHVWELDIFTGRHAGLGIAEIELPDHKTRYQKPAWLGPEITQDKRLSNSSLARTGVKEIMKWVADYRPKAKGPSGPAP
ncbi:MAG: Adenylate cyclase [Micavibrio sp.]|nr:Adenylate cyclase [Micavibrio sp.]